ncbi:MAG: tetratricopeptide repeat protein [Minicystis sp.]
MITDLKRRVVLHPEDAEARYALAEALFVEQQVDAAIKQLEEALTLRPDHDGARRLLARAYLREGRRVPAERTLEEAVRRQPRDAGARDELAELLIEGGRFDDAIVHLEEACKDDPGNLSRRLLIADLARRRALFARARRHLEHARRLAPGDAAVIERLHALALDLGEPGGPPPSPLTRGRDHLLGRTRAALLQEPLRSAVGAGAVQQIAACLSRSDVLGAKRAIVTARPDEQANVAFAVLRAEILLIENNLTKAERAFRRVTEDRPDLALGWSRLAEILSAAGKHDEAVIACEHLVALADRDPDAIERLGDELLAAGRRDDAIARWKKAFSIRPDAELMARIAAVEHADRPPREDERVPGRIGALGWNATGGIVSPLEAAAVPGRGELVFTGNVGKVGQDAAKVAYSCLKARADALGIAARIEKSDLHLHFVDTGNAKDGPSAGLALALAGVSALTARPLIPRLAATGELTPHGAVRPVGGLHEKLVAAFLADIAVVIVPRHNLFDIKTLPGEVVERLRIVYVDALAEALAHAFGEGRDP